MTHIVPETMADYDKVRVTERPDGFYWMAREGGREFGPFPTLIEAVRDMQYTDAAGIEPGETLEEAEADIGIAAWTDPDTGEPAEEGVPRLEDH